MRIVGLDGASIELARVAPGFAPHGHMHESPHACLVMQGLLLDRADGGSVLETEQDCMRFNPAGVAHWVGAPAEGALCLVFEFCADAGESGAPIYSADLARRLRLDAIELEIRQDPARRLLAAHRAIATAMRAGKRSGEVSDDPEMCAIAKLIEADSRIAAREFSRVSGAHRATLTRRFQIQHGLAPRRYRLLMRLSQAARALAAGETGAHAAADAGFVDQAHLNKAWRALLGGTPARWAAGRIATNVQDRKSLSR